MRHKKIYFENLNGLRFFAFFSVFTAHCFDFMRFKFGPETGQEVVNHFFLNGDLGVNFFFVLSGFLITYLLLKEKEEKQNISIGKFYMRRILRIWPVYFITLFLGFFLIPFLFRNVDHGYFPFAIDATTDKLPWYLFFAANFDIVNNGASYLLIAVLWSVSVEEQYYLVWPIIHKISSRVVLNSIICLLIVISFCYRWKYYQYSYSVKYSLFSVMEDLAVGSLFGILSFDSEKFRAFFAGLKKWTITLVYVLLFVCICSRLYLFLLPQQAVQLLVSLEPFIFSLFFGFIILEQNYAANSPFKLSGLRFLGYLGTISYGLYCYHLICIFLVSVLFTKLFPETIDKSLILFIVQFFLALGLSILLSGLSYRFIEARFLKLKNKFSEI